MRKIFALLLSLVLLPCASLAEMETIPEKPDYLAMPIEEAAMAIGQNTLEAYWQFLSCEVYPDVIYVDVKQEGLFFDTQSLLIASIRFAIEYMQEAFLLDQAPQLYFRFHENGRDQYGQQVDMITITMRITREKAAELNLEYFHEYAVTKQLAFLQAINGYSLFRDYKAIAQ